jgi:hypothetical protein
MILKWEKYTSGIMVSVRPQSRVARFFLVHNTKTGENIPIDDKIYQMAIKYFQ